MSTTEAMVSLGGTSAACFLAYLWYQTEAHKRNLAHAERLKSLELGQSLPDSAVARSHAQVHRAWAAGCIGFLTPVCLTGGAVGATAIVMYSPHLDLRAMVQLPLLCTVWAVAGLVSLLAVINSLSVLRRETAVPVEPEPTTTKPSAPLPRSSLNPQDLPLELATTEAHS